MLGMTPLNDIEQRLEALEIKASFTEDLVDKLDQIIIEQQRTLEAVLSELRDLRAQATSSADGGAQRNLRDDLPPHY
jgi:SlyX protein